MLSTKVGKIFLLSFQLLVWQSLYDCRAGSLLLHYALNGDLVDSSGSGNNPINNGGAFTTNRFGKLNSAIAFNSFSGGPLGGSGQWIESSVPGLPIGNQPRTISVWINFKAHERWESVVDYGEHAPGKRFGILVRTGSILIVGHSYDIRVDSLLLTENVWRHVCVTFDGTQSKVYIDSNLAASEPRTYQTAASVLRIGQTPPNNFNQTEWFDGAIDDVFIFARALTDAEVHALFQLDSPLPELQLRPFIALEVEFDTQAGVTYNFETTEDFINWKTNAVIFGNDTASSTLFSTRSFNSLFYRVRPVRFSPE